MHARKSRMSASPVAFAVAAALAAVPAARAQQAGANPEGLEEIVVTAQKREQNLQEVPIAVSVVNGSLLDAVGGFNTESLKRLVPALNIRKTNTAINQALFLRGVGTINFAIAAQPSVAFVLDGVVMASSGEAFGDLYDVDRVEVLAGPQGTLYGKNASAGVVNVVSTKPGNVLDGYADLAYYQDNEVRLRGAVDIPLGDKLKTRTTAFWGSFDGYLNNISDTPAGGDANGYDRWGARTIWVADPTDNVKLTFIGDYRKSDDNCCAEIIGNAPTGANAAALAKIWSGVQFKGVETRDIKQNLAMKSTEEAWGLSLQADIGVFTDYTLTSITAYRNWDATEYREGDWKDIPAPYVGTAFAQQHDYGPQTLDTFSQELRITSPGGQFIDWVGGLYYANTNSDRYFRRDDVVCTASTLAADSTGSVPCEQGKSTYIYPSANAKFGATFDTFAAFADGTVNVTDRWRVIGGLRWTQDDLSYYHNYNFSPVAGPGVRAAPAGTPPEKLKGDDTSDQVSGRAGLQFDVTDDVMSYFTYARGYKGPAYNVFFNMGPNNTEVLDPETADSYEIGLKSTLLDDRLILNIAAWDAQYSNFQANNYTYLNGTLITTLTNAGDVSTQGVSVDFLARPFDALSLSGGIAYTDAKVDKFFTPPGQKPTVANDTQLPLAPKWKGSLAADYTMEFGEFNVVPTLVFSYTGDQYGDLNEPPALLMPSYSTLDLAVAISDKPGRYRLTLYANNLTDQSYAVLMTAASGAPSTGGAPRLQIPREADRVFGAEFRMNFGGSR
ncbi:MAG: TonB-dependent receptor [Gammaproteobacteria bacterium]|nr:TonB-dependent receptor [Gammaproteobacteria bacterium]